MLYGFLSLHVVGKVNDGGGKFLQEFPDVLGNSFHLRVERYFLVVITIAILKCFNNLFIRCFSRNAMKDVASQHIQGGDQVCGFLTGRRAVVPRHGLELLSVYGL